LDGAGIAAAGIAVFLLAGGVRRAFLGERPAVVAALGAAAFLPVWLLWDVGNVEHTVISAPFFAVLVAFGARDLPRHLGRWLLGLLALALLVGNGIASAVPQALPENGRTWTVASFVRQTVPENGVILSLGRDPRLRLGLQYLTGRRVVDLTLLVESARRQGVSAHRAVAYWRSKAEEARTVWMLPGVLADGADDWVRSLGVDPRGVAGLVARMQPLRTAVLAPDGVVIQKPYRLTLVAIRPPARGTPARPFNSTP